jgi:hypothetical protein
MTDEDMKHELVNALAAIAYADGFIVGCGHKNTYISTAHIELLERVSDLVAADKDSE